VKNKLLQILRFLFFAFLAGVTFGWYAEHQFTRDLMMYDRGIRKGKMSCPAERAFQPKGVTEAYQIDYAAPVDT
jgi:hypothetical protein